MKEPIFLDVKGIKCDNTQCDYADMEVEFDPEKYLNMPCPKCGENLFTQADYDLMQELASNVKKVNQLFAETNIKITDDMPRVIIETIMDGTGSLEVGKVSLE